MFMIYPSAILTILNIIGQNFDHKSFMERKVAENFQKLATFLKSEIDLIKIIQ